MILLTQTPVCRADFGIDPAARAFAVVAHGHPAPVDVPALSLTELLDDPLSHLREPGTMVVVGFSRLLTPSNRVKVGPYLLRQRPGIRRVVADDVMFVSEPWRLWWHLFAVGREAWGFSNSFLAESRWKMAVEKQTEDPFSISRVQGAIRGVVRARDPFRFPPVEVEVVPVGAEVHAAYAEEKERAFTDEKTLPAIVKRLAAIADHALPARHIPSVASLWRSPPTRIVRTDLKVDEFLVEQIVHRMALTNAIADVAEGAA